MVSFAPRLDSRLIAAAERLDSRTTPIAETNRRVGQVAEALGLQRPSYEAVRRIVTSARQRGRHPTAGDVLLEIAFRTRPPEDFIDYLAGTLPPFQ